jgi:hypothetical protein
MRANSIIRHDPFLIVFKTLIQGSSHVPYKKDLSRDQRSLIEMTYIGMFRLITLPSRRDHPFPIEHIGFNPGIQAGSDEHAM